jgi:hypothetical protein
MYREGANSANSLMDSNVLVKRLHMLLWIALRWKSETEPYYYTAKL